MVEKKKRLHGELRLLRSRCEGQVAVGQTSTCGCATENTPLEISAGLTTLLSVSSSACKPTSLLLYRHHRNRRKPSLGPYGAHRYTHDARQPDLRYRPVAASPYWDTPITFSHSLCIISRVAVEPWINVRGTKKNENECTDRNDENSFAARRARRGANFGHAFARFAAYVVG